MLRGLPLVLVFVASLAAVVPADAALVYQRTASRAIVAASNDGSHARVIAHGLNPSIAPGGKRVGFFKRNKEGVDTLYVVGIRGRHPRLLAHAVFGSGIPPVTSCAWSPDGRSVVVGDAHGFAAWLIDVSSGKRRHVQLENGYGGASFSPSGKQIAFADAAPHGSRLRIVARKSLRGREVADDGSHPLWSRSGIAFGQVSDDDTSSIAVKRTPDAARRRVFASQRIISFPVAWSAGDGTLLGAELDQVREQTAVLIDRKTGKARALPRSFTYVDGLSRDGAQVLAERRGQVLSVGLDGTETVLARGAKLASWTR